jgi:hypothetical protein
MAQEEPNSKNQEPKAAELEFGSWFLRIFLFGSTLMLATAAAGAK